MRLIDADALERTLVEAQAECKKNGGNFRFGVLSNVRANVADAPTIAAIPVEWLRGLMIEYANINTPEHAAYAYCLNNVIDGWRKEQEAR